MVHINTIYFRNKLNMFANSVSEYIDIVMISETELDYTFRYALYHLKDFSNSYRLERNSYSRGIFVSVRDYILFYLIKLDKKAWKF